MAKKDFKALGDKIVELVGGEGNINSLTHCVTRLRFKLKDASQAKTEELKGLDGVMTVVQAAGQYQVVIGNEVNAAFDAIVSNHAIKTEDALDINEGDVPEKPNGLKGYYEKVLDYITGTMVQTLPILLASGLMSVVLAVATNFFGVQADDPTYQVYNFVYNTGFYFLPIMVGFAAAKKLGSNPFLGALTGAVLIHPTLIAWVANGDATSLFGMGFQAINYSSSVIPMLVIMPVEALIEKALYKYLPNALKVMLAPLCTMLLIVPIELFILGPLGYFVGSAIANFVIWVHATAPFIVVPLTAVAWPLLVMVGAHTLLVPTMTDLVTTMGFDSAIKPGGWCSNWAILGTLLAVIVKTKDAKQREVALTAATSNVFGVTEPALYGVIIPLKSTMIGMLGGSAIGGLVAGLLSVKAYAPAANSILSIPMFGDTIVMAAIATLASIAGGFVITWLVYREK